MVWDCGPVAGPVTLGRRWPAPQGRQGIREKSGRFEIRMPLVLEGQIRRGQPNIH